MFYIVYFFTLQLNEKENILLEKFSSEWNKQRLEMETEIVSDIEHCKNMINQLNSIANEVKTRAYATAERENKVIMKVDLGSISIVWNLKNYY